MKVMPEATSDQGPSRCCICPFNRNDDDELHGPKKCTCELIASVRRCVRRTSVVAIHFSIDLSRSQFLINCSQAKTAEPWHKTVQESKTPTPEAKCTANTDPMTVSVNFGYLIALKKCDGVVIKRPAERDVRFKSIFTNEKKSKGPSICHSVIQRSIN